MQSTCKFTYTWHICMRTGGSGSKKFHRGWFSSTSQYCWAQHFTTNTEETARMPERMAHVTNRLQESPWRWWVHENGCDGWGGMERIMPTTWTLRFRMNDHCALKWREEPRAAFHSPPPPLHRCGKKVSSRVMRPDRNRNLKEPNLKET